MKKWMGRLGCVLTGLAAVIGLIEDHAKPLDTNPLVWLLLLGYTFMVAGMVWSPKCQPGT